MKSRSVPWILIFVPLLLGSLACKALAIVGGTGKDQPGEILFRDDFSNSDSGWNRVSTENGETDYADGVYRIFVNQANTDVWARPGLEFDDARIQVDAFKVGGDRDNRFGVICRVLDDRHFYTFIISSDGYYGIGKVKEEAHTLIGATTLQPNEAIELGSAINHIRADCIADTLTLYVNGQMLAQVQDDEYTYGDAGLIAGTYDTPGTDIRFDNFAVISP